MRNARGQCVGFAFVLLAGVGLVSCSSSSSSNQSVGGGGGGAGGAFPSGLVIASLTAYSAPPSFFSRLKNSVGFSRGTGASFTPKLSYSEKVAYINSILS